MSIAQSIFCEGGEMVKTINSEINSLRKRELSVNLRKIMADRSLNGSEVGRMMSEYLPEGEEVSRQSVNLYCRGVVFPTLRSLSALVRALDVDVADLVGPRLAEDLQDVMPKPSRTARPEGTVSFSVRRASPDTFWVEFTGPVNKSDAELLMKIAKSSDFLSVL